MISSKQESIGKISTGIPGFDHIALGGLPKHRTTLISGTAGSAKTVIAVQFLAAGILMSGETGVFVTFEESPDDIRRNMIGFDWDIGQWEREGKWIFIDASIDPEQETVFSGSFDLGALMARIEHAVREVNASRVSMDSLGAIFGRFADSDTVRKEMHRLSVALRRMSVTAVITAERTEHPPS